MRKLQDYILVFVKGLCMGATEVVHGVSASTMSLILGVYHEFINALHAIDRKSVKLLKEKKFAAFWTTINGKFLAPLLLGVFFGLWLLSSFISLLLQHHFILITSFLFGLITISGILLLRKIRKWKPITIVFFVLGIAINYLITTLPPLHTSDNLLFTALAGFFAGFTLTFPGVSSAYILLLIGQYQYVLYSFANFRVGIISIFFINCLLGLWVASRFIYRILADYYCTTVALLAGLTLGALNKLWPWRTVFEYVTNSKGKQIPAYDKSVLPWQYTALTGKDPQIFQAIVMVALGVLMVVLIEKIAAGLKTKI